MIVSRALAALASLPPQERLDVAARRLAGGPGGPLCAFAVGSELFPSPAQLDGRLLEAIAARTLGGARGAGLRLPMSLGNRPGSLRFWRNS